MKSNQVIFGNLSYSETTNQILIRRLIIPYSETMKQILWKKTNNTVYSWISKENVHYGNVVFIGIVVGAFLKKVGFSLV